MPAQRHMYIRVVHDDSIVAAGVVAILSARDDLFATTYHMADPGQAIASTSAEPCDLVIADHSRAMELARAARPSRERAPASARILVLTNLDREWDVRVAMKAGVHGYLLQRSKADDLVDAALAICAGKRYMSGEVAAKLAYGLMQEELTVREMDVLVAMSTGASNKAISRALGISGGTVKSHVRSILGKVGACARTEAVAIAAQRGLTSRYGVGAVNWAGH